MVLVVSDEASAELLPSVQAVIEALCCGIVAGIVSQALYKIVHKNK